MDTEEGERSTHAGTWAAPLGFAATSERGDEGERERETSLPGSRRAGRLARGGSGSPAPPVSHRRRCG